MLKLQLTILVSALFTSAFLNAGEVVETPRPVPATRPEMKKLLEEMKTRPYRIPLPKLTEADREALGERADNYESRLRYHYLPQSENSSYSSRVRSSRTNGQRPRTRPNADENMSLTYPFKTRLFWIVSRTNNCQYCLGHQEEKLFAAGMSEIEIARLDSNWSLFDEAEQAAFAYARKLTYEPNRLTDADINALRAHYNDLQILEITMSVAGNNATNRWKEGTGIPQSSGGVHIFAQADGAAPNDSSLSVETYLTPTPKEFQTVISTVAPLELTERGTPTGRGISSRPPLGSRSDVEQMLTRAKSRESRLPLLSPEQARDALGEAAPEGKLENWMRLVAHFPNDSRRRFSTVNSLDDPAREQGDLTPLLKAQVAWIVARQDRAWYATGRAMSRLKQLGQSETQIFDLDGEWESFSAKEQALFRFARQQAATPIALTDEDAARALALSSPREVVQLINFVTGCVYLDRVSEAAGLPLDPSR